MPRFFCEGMRDQQAKITGADAKHISKVLRMREGDALTLCDGKGTDYQAVIQEIGEEITLKVLKSEKNQSEPEIQITLYQAMPKGDKLDFIVQKAVELGCVRVVPIVTKYCVARPKADSVAKKQERLQKIAFEAAKQCGRGVIPEIGAFQTMEEAAAEIAGQTTIVFYEGGGEKVKNILPEGEKKVNLFVGSEGGFAKEEIELLTQSGAKCATLGKLILRCETAPIAGITLVLAASGTI